MTILKITVEDEQVEMLKKVLQEISFVKGVEEESTVKIKPKKKGTAVEQIQKLQLEIGGKKLFSSIKDPADWQREIRKEWDRDF